MDVRPNLFQKVLSVLTIILFVFTSIACQKKEKKPEVIDDNNSQFSGKSCYGSSIKNQYILNWSNGTHSIFNGTKEELQNLLENQVTSDEHYIVKAEQNRKFLLKKEYLSEGVVTKDIISVQDSFWQVWGQEDTQVNELWDKKIKGKGITVAVVDGVIDQSHPSLKNRIYSNTDEIPNNGIDDDNNGLVDDYNGFDFSSKTAYGDIISDHGTHVAGIIASEPINSPMLGVAPETTILPIGIFGGEFGGELATVIFALKYAESRGSKIINASWGGPICAELLRDTIQSLTDKDILFINAAGNYGVNIENEPEYPAAFNLENQITVGASMPSGLMASFSNYGYEKVHILAPGHLILSTVHGGWGLNSGTSMAVPFVSGIAALLWSAYPNASAQQIKKAILNSVRDPQDFNPVLSKGRINSVLALEQLEKILSY